MDLKNWKKNIIINYGTKKVKIVINELKNKLKIDPNKNFLKIKKIYLEKDSS